LPETYEILNGIVYDIPCKKQMKKDLDCNIYKVFAN